MHVEYDTTIDEIVDAYLRALSLSKAAKRARWQASLWTTLLTGIILFLWGTFLRAPITHRCAFTVLGVLVTTGGYNLTYRQNLRRRLRKHLLNQMPSGTSMRFMVELRDDCIWTKQAGNQMSFDWGNVSEVVDTGDALEVRVKGGGMVVVRNKGFQSQQERSEFLNVSKGHALAHSTAQ
jgi:hypothetical protein